MKLLFVKGALPTLDRFTDQLITAASSRQIAFTILKASDPPQRIAEQIIRVHEQDAACAALIFNNTCLSLTINQLSIWDTLHIPVFDILVDHPINYLKYMEHPIRELRIITVDRNHRDFVKALFPEVRDVFFLPHGGIISGYAKPYEDRKIDVLYTGSCQKEKPYDPIPFMSDHGVSFYNFICAELLQNPSETSEGAVKHYIEKYALQLPLSLERQLHLYASVYCRSNILRAYRHEVIRQLSATGINVSIYGENWEDENSPFADNIHIHPRVSPEACEELLGNAKISLNIMPWFKDGAHERIFEAMLNGAVCVTDTSSYLRERFIDGKDLVFYELTNLPQMVCDIQWLLSHPAQAADITENALLAASNDRWEDRFDELMRMVYASGITDNFPISQ